MNRKYWDNISKIYEREVFNVVNNDKNKLIIKILDKYSSKQWVACDFGCGIGRCLPLLSERFKKVYAIDYSRKCLNVAKKRNKHLNNIHFIEHDLCKYNLDIPCIDFSVCINMVILPSYKKRLAILNNIYKYISGSGYLLLVLPSLESALYSNFRLFEWESKEGRRLNEVISSGLIFRYNHKGSLVDGLLNMAGIVTKHYIKEELKVVLKKIGFSIISFQKVEYGWETEFYDPPKWIKGPYPWDWSVLCQKK